MCLPFHRFSRWDEESQVELGSEGDDPSYLVVIVIENNTELSVCQIKSHAHQGLGRAKDTWPDKGYGLLAEIFFS